MPSHKLGVPPLLVVLVFLVGVFMGVALSQTFNVPTGPSVEHLYRPHGSPDPPFMERKARLIEAQADSVRASFHSIPVRLARQIRLAANRHAIPLPIAYRLVWVESRFTPGATSVVGARGLTQVMPTTGLLHCGLPPERLYTISTNLDCGFSYLRMLHDRLDAWLPALASYNAGMARYLRAHRTGEYSGVPYARVVMGM